MTTLRLIKSTGRSSSRLALLVIPLVFACFALSPMAQAVSPPPVGGYPGQNTATGYNALFNLSPTNGGFNTAIGWLSLFANTTGSLNTGVGAGTLSQNTSHNNTAVGAGALLTNTTGDANTANGALALLQNTVGQGNTAVGAATLFSNTAGSGNTAVGAQALQSISGGLLNSQNTAVGQGALQNASGGGSNTAVGAEALKEKTTGDSNTAIGGGALSSNTTGSGNIAVGDNAGVMLTTGGNNIDIGNDGGATDEANTIRIGTTGTQTVTFITGISGTAVVGDPVVVDANGQLGTATSSARFKKDIKPMAKTSAAILSLKPVSFQYKSDSKGIPQFGLIAEDVAKVNPDLVVRDRNGKIYSVRYEAVNAMLLNEFLNEHSTVQELKKEVAALTAGLQKVSAQLEANKPAPQVVNNNQ